MRADRLVAIVLLLQVHGKLTAGQLAVMLETSERTVRRDLDALCIAGVPLYSLRGRGGGWTLLGGHRLDLSGFTAEEARALFLVAGAQEPIGSGGEASGLRSALRKLLAALPAPLRDVASAAEAAVVVDPARWGRAPERTVHLEALQAAVVDRVQVDIDYVKPGGDARRRRVRPYGLVAKSGVWYLLAGTPGGRRTFRLSRVRAVERTAESFELPPSFDLAGAWDEAQRDYADRMRVVEVELDVADQAVLRLSASVRGWATADERPGGPPGWRRMTVSFPYVEAAAAHLAPFGGAVRVRGPLELREALCRLGEELVQANR